MSISSRRAGEKPMRAPFVARFARVVVALSLSFLSVPLLTQASYAEGDAPIVSTETTADPPAAEDPPAAAPAEEPAAVAPAPELTAEEPAAEEPPADPAVEEPAAEQPAADPTTDAPATDSGKSDGPSKNTAKFSSQLALPDPNCGVTDFNQNTQEDGGGSWINGALNQNNSNYAEGDYVPQRVQLDGLVPGDYTLKFSYDVTKNGKYAYDFVKFLDISGSAGATATWDAFEGPKTALPPVGTQTVFVTVSFTIVDSNDATATISWKGHIASEVTYGPNSSAGSISGAPYHFSLIDTNDTADAFGCDTGSRDNQLMADAVDFATVTVVKDALPNSSTAFDFNLSAPNSLSADFDLVDDGTPTNTVTYNVPPGVTTVTETPEAGWDLTDLVCTGSTPGVESGTGVALTLADDDAVTCTFTNSHEASIEVDKYWVINDGQPVLEGDEPGHLGLNAQLLIDQAAKDWATVYGGYLEGATANLGESVGLGDMCHWASSDPLQHGRLTEDNTVDVNLSLPHDVTLGGGANHYTITNSVTCDSELTLVKSVKNGPAQASAWTLSASSGSGMAFASGSTGVTHPVTADTAYTLSENDADTRYEQLGSWSCTQYGHFADGAVTVDVGRSATCTVTNATGVLVLKKAVQNPNGGTAVPGDFTLVADPVGPGSNLTTPGSANGTTFYVDPSETFNLSETGGPDGYTLSGINCGNGSVTSVQVPIDTTVTCTYTNVDSPGVLTLNKHVVSDSGDGAQATDWTLSATPVNIANQPVISGDGTATGATKAGTYQLAEDGLGGYAAGAWDCNDSTTDADVPVNADDQIVVGPNQEVVCDITNRAIAPTLTLVKSVQDPENTGDETGPEAFTLTATPDGIAGQDPLSGPGGASDTVKVGTYALSETGPSTYAADPTGWHCVDDDGAVAVTGGEVTLGLDQDVVCTIINNAIPSSYMLEKTSDPASGATVMPNSEIHYTVTLTKVGDGVPVENFDVTDTLTGVEDSWVSGLADDGATISGGVITWHIDELGNTPLTLTYTVTVGPDAWDSTIENQVTPGPTPCVDEQTDNGVVDCDFTEHFTPHYTLDKAVKLLATPGDNDGLAEPGEQLEYSLTVLNDTADATFDTQVTDDLTGVLSNAQMITDTDALAAQGLALGDDGILTWTINDLAPGESRTVTYVVQINDHAWNVSLDNIATPAPLSGGECIPAGDVPGDGEDSLAECQTSTPTPDVTTMVVEKRDVETDEVLPGATFELFLDANNEVTEGGDCTFASPPVVDDQDVSLGTSETGIDGQALFNELQHGCYLLVETVPPDGYSLPTVHVMGVQIDEANFVGMDDGGKMAAIVITDFGEGHLAIVAKRQFEKVDGAWVESDGKVGFGDHVRYVVRVEATGPKNFHNVHVTDFVPGYSPEDTTSTVKATLVPGSAVCEGTLTCSVSVSADNEVTWDIGDVLPANGETIAGDAVMEVVFPDKPADLKLAEGEIYEATLWNVGYLKWTELTSPTTPAARIAHAAGRAGLLGTAVADLPTTDITLRSNEVVVKALAKGVAGKKHNPGPGPLPTTGAPAGMGQLALFGLALIAGGLTLMRRSRKE